MLHWIFTILMVVVAVATLWFAIYVIVRLFKTDAPVTAPPSPSVGASNDSTA